MSDTPRTDAQVADRLDHAKYKVDIDFARQLERENARLREALRSVLPYAAAYTDEGPDPEGWQSKEVKDNLAAAKAADSVCSLPPCGGGLGRGVMR